MTQMQFNAQGIDPEFGGFSQDPIWSDGWNRVIITSDRVVELGQNAGKMLAFEIRSQEGPDVGKTGTVMCSVWHNDPAKRDRAIQQMAAICFAVGVGGYNDTQELFNRPFWIENKAGRTRKGNDGKEYPTNSFQNVRNNAGVEPGKVAGPGGGAPSYGAPALPPTQPPMAPAMPPGQPGWGPGTGGQPAPSAAPAWGPPAAPPPSGAPTAPPSSGAPGWGPPPGGGAPAAPSFAPPAAPGGAPAWGPPGAPQGGQPPAFQPPQGQPPGQPPAQGWAPGTPPAAPAWGPPR